MTESEVDAAIRQLELEMEDLQHRHRDLFAYANAWAVRYDSILARVPDALRASAERAAAHRRRWGVAHGVG